MAPEEDIWLAVDSSGSVGGSKAYFDEVSKVLTSYPRAKSYFLWDSTVQEMTFEAMESWVQNRGGHGGTSPSELAKFISEKSFHGVLRFMTDGDVPGYEVDSCDEWLHGDSLSGGSTGHTCAKVEAYIVETGCAINRSVILPFMRFSPSEVKYIHRDSRCPDVEESISAEDIELFETFVKQQTDFDFEVKAERLKEVAQARFMGTLGSARVRDAAIKFKNRLTKEMSDRLGQDVGMKLLHLLQDSEDTSEEAMLIARGMVSDFMAIKGETPAIKTLDAIIGLCDGIARKCFSKADAEKAISTPMQRADTLVEPTETLPVAPEEALGEETWFQCPVTLEESTSNLVLMLAWSGVCNLRGAPQSAALGPDKGHFRWEALGQPRTLVCELGAGFPSQKGEWKAAAGATPPSFQSPGAAHIGQDVCFPQWPSRAAYEQGPHVCSVLVGGSRCCLRFPKDVPATAAPQGRGAVGRAGPHGV